VAVVLVTVQRFGWDHLLRLHDRQIARTTNKGSTRGGIERERVGGDENGPKDKERDGRSNVEAGPPDAGGAER
jgi:hypothetical protein